MFLKTVSFLFCFILVISSPDAIPYSRGKQQKFFPKELKDTGVYLGMSLEKFTKVRKKAQADTIASIFKIKYTENVDTEFIQSYTYLLTPTPTPQIYSIEVTYKAMENVKAQAIKAMGKPNYKGEWRIPAKTIKEDFMMGAWNFGNKLVYSGTIVSSEWERGFEN